MKRKNIQKVKEIEEKILPILKSSKIKRAALFGSTVKGGDNKKSDIDILIEADESLSLLDLINLKLKLEEALGKKVDLVEYQTIKPALREYILGEQLQIL